MALYVQVEDPQYEQFEDPEQAIYDEYDAEADAMDNVRPEDVAAIIAAEKDQPAAVAPPMGGMPPSAALLNLENRSHHQYACDGTSTGKLGLTAAW